MQHIKGPFLTNFKKKGGEKSLLGNSSNKYLTVGSKQINTKAIEVKKQYISPYSKKSFYKPKY
jgi:hypothetical protein